MKKFVIGCAVLLLSISMAGCRDWNRREGACWQITQMTSSLQSIDNQGLRQNYNYQLTLKFTGEEAINIHAMEPILEGPIAARVVSSLDVEVEKSMKPGETVDVSGQFVIDSSGLSKHELLDMEPYFSNVRVLVGEKVPLPMAVPSVQDTSSTCPLNK